MLTKLIRRRALLRSEALVLKLNSKVDCYLEKISEMTYAIEKTDREILSRLPIDTTPKEIQGILNYFRYLELGLKNNIEQSEIDEMAKEAKSGWWEQNKERFDGLL